MAKAYLELTDSAGGSSRGGGRTINFQFNPETFALKKEAEWIVDPPSAAGKAPPPQYRGPKPASMSLVMLLDASDQDEGDVSQIVEELFEACSPTAKSEADQRPLPQFVKFGWRKVHFTGYITSVQAEYTLFRPDGRPIRARCTVALDELPVTSSRQNPTSGGTGARGSHVVVSGDTLAGVAYREYGRPGLWRAIAEANSIDDPMRLAAGSRLDIPPVTDAMRHA